MLDKDIRRVLLKHIREEDAVSLNEVSICRGKTIMDVLHVSDRLVGYEIKSNGDNYSRLHTQVANYDRVCDECWIVAGDRHVNTIKHHVPVHWGIIIIDEYGATTYREASENPDQRQEDVLELLWKDEVIHLLKKFNKYKGMAGKRQKLLCERVMLEIGYGHIHEYVVDTLKTRTWYREKTR